MKLLKALIPIGSLLLVTSASAKTFPVDTNHTSVTFKIRHLLGMVPGQFKMVSGKFEVDDKTGALTHVEGVVKAESIDTNNKDRDKDLRSPHFFDVKKFHEITFVSDPMNIKKGHSGKMTGMLTMHGVSKKVTWKVDYAGMLTDDSQTEHVAFTAMIDKLNRKDFGIVYNKAFGAGEMMIGDTVHIDLSAEGKAPVTVADRADANNGNKKHEHAVPADKKAAHHTANDKTNN